MRGYFRRLHERYRYYSTRRGLTMDPPLFNSIINDLGRHPSKNYKKRELEDIEYVVIHRCKLSDTTEYGDAEKDLAEYFVREMDWPGFPYHFSISKKGKIYQCQPLTATTYQVKNYNKKCIGIRLEGDFREELPNLTQYAYLVQITASIIIYMGLTEFDISGHSEFSGHEKKDCPGKMFDLDMLRLDVETHRKYMVKNFGFVE